MSPISREYILYLEDMLLSMDRIQEYLGKNDFQNFRDNSMLVDAIVRNFEIIGEASKNIPIEIRNKYPQIPWSKMYSLRNLISHEYFGIDYEMLWEIAKKNLPDNRKDLIAVIKTEKKQNKMNTKAYVDKHQERFINELIELLKIPSVSADSSHKKDMESAAKMVAEQLKNSGCDVVNIYPTKGHAVVFGQKIVDPELPTVLVYGHYDVQPPDPIDLWDSPPFDPVIKKTDIHPEGAIYARGACDDKGQMFMHVKALELMMAENALPCNIKFMIEGEEEVGSEHLEDFIKEHNEMLANDVILISDTGMISKNHPSITTGLRGLSYVEVEVTGPNRDLHSGLYGGAVANPINILTQMIASLQDENNRITIPGFYDKVEELSKEERDKMAEAPFNLENYKASIGIGDVHGEKGYVTNERNSIRPTLDVNGIWGGYIGEGAKTVIASKAYAKISMRLVPNQDWREITELFKTHFESIAPKSVSVKVKPHHGGQGYVTPIDSVEYEAADKAFQDTFGKPAIPLRSGGSIPIVSLFENAFNSKTVLMGFGLDTDAIHSPNEHFGIWNFLKGIETIPHFYKHFAALHA